MHDVNCPYCDAEIEINHDDGYGYEENEAHEQECGKCVKVFIYETSISFHYDVYKADCKNDGEHKWEKINGHPKEFFKNKRRCSICREEKTI